MQNKKIDNVPRLISGREIQKRFGIHSRTIGRMAKQLGISEYRFSGTAHRLYDGDQVMAAILRAKLKPGRVAK